MNFQGDELFTTDQGLANGMGVGGNQLPLETYELKFIHFIRNTQENGIYIYREQLKNNALRQNYFLKFEMRHLQAFDEDLAEVFREKPADLIKVFETAVEVIYRNDIHDISNPDMEESPRFQVQVHTDENPVMLRELQSNLVGRLVVVPGIITSTSKSKIHARKAVFVCRKCGFQHVQEVKYGLSRVTEPGLCRNPGQDGKNSCGLGTIKFSPDLSEFVD